MGKTTGTASFGLGMDARILRDALGQGPLTRPTRRQLLRQKTQRTVARAVTNSLGVADRLGVRMVRCEICGWEGPRFRPLAQGGWLQMNAVCWACGSVQRQRLFALALGRSGTMVGTAVWMAPEACLAQVMARIVGEVVTIDLEMEGVDLLADAESLPFRSGSVGAVVSSDVLEHVADDSRALMEIRRVLRTDGVCVLHVPVLWSETVEYGFAQPLEFGHRRGYGPDVVDRLASAGFEAETVTAAEWSEGDRRRLGLLDWDVAFILRPRTG